MTLMSMTFHESFGELPTHLLTQYRRFNVSPADHDRMLAMATDSGRTDWTLVLELVQVHSSSGYLALPYYF